MPRLPHLLSLIGTGLLLTACSSSGVEIATPHVTAAERTACEKVLAALPDKLDGLPAQQVTPADALGRAWGDPAVVLTCGVSMPKGFQPGASCEENNGVGWYVPTDQFGDLGEDLTVFTIGRTPAVELLVPAEQRRDGAFAADALATLADPIKQAIPTHEPCV